MSEVSLPVCCDNRFDRGGRPDRLVRLTPVVSFAGAGKGGKRGAGGGSGGASASSGSHGGGGHADHIAAVLDRWLADVARLLDQLQKVLEQAHENATGDERNELSALLASLRECRSQVPDPQMIQAWLKALTGRDPH